MSEKVVAHEEKSADDGDVSAGSSRIEAPNSAASLEEGSTASMKSSNDGVSNSAGADREGDPMKGTSNAEDALSLDKTITRFRFQYDKLHRSLARSMEAERKLVDTTKNLRMKLVDNSKKIELAYKWKSEDQKTIRLLRRELTRSWEVAETYRQKELKAQELIKSLQEEIEALSHHAHDSLGSANNKLATASIISSAQGSIGKTHQEGKYGRPEPSLSTNVPTFAEWKRQRGVHTPNAARPRKGALSPMDGSESPFRRPRTTPIKTRPRTPLEYATQR